MTEINRADLFGKFNTVGYQSLEAAFTACRMRGNPEVELSHWIHQILQLDDSDLHRIIRHFGLDPARLSKDLTESLDRLPRGASSVSDFSYHVLEGAERAWVYGSLLFKTSKLRTAHFLIGLLKTSGLREALFGLSGEFRKIKTDLLVAAIDEVTHGSPEELIVTVEGPALEAADSGSSSAAMGKLEALKRFSVDLTERARQGEIDPIVGRDDEIRQIIDILMRRRQNNPILTGEAGVGKTAVVEGFALCLAAGDVPPPLQGVSLRVLDLGLLQAGASVKGEFEERLRAVIDDVQASPKPIILFIDEAHSLIGAGGAAGTGDAANLLKPALARGTLRTIAATTWAEYKKYFEKDPALTRRFQVVQVDEPDEEKAMLMMRRMVPVMERHHRVQVLDEAIEAAVKLSRRYIPARQLPDKAVSLLDTAAARVAISLHAVPAAVDDSRKRIDALETETDILQREEMIGLDVATHSAQVAQDLIAERDRLAKLEERWFKEKELTSAILELQTKLHGVADDEFEEDPASAIEPVSTTTQNERVAWLADLEEARARLTVHLGDEPPLISIMVDAETVGAVVQDWTGIPVGRMVRDEVKTVLNLTSFLGKRVIGQDHALEMIAKRIETSRAGLDNPNKPVGVFMLCGPSGVGKTETALALAESLYGGEQNLITINMSEFQESHSVSTLKGAPPGYIGYGEGGLLTEAVRRRPYSVVLLDEVEKAHPDVHEIFFQIFDKGVMEDGEGRLIDFKNTLILLTSNVGSDLIMTLCKDPELLPEPEGLAQMLRGPLLKVFPAALLGRLIAIPYVPLSDEMIKAIAMLQLGRIQDRVAEKHAVPFTYDDEVIDLIAKRCTELDSGGRMIDAILTNTVLPAISREALEHSFRGDAIEKVHVEVADDDFKFCF